MCPSSFRRRISLPACRLRSDGPLRAALCGCAARRERRVGHITLYRGLAAALAPILDKEAEPASSWHGAVRAAGAALLARAQQSGAVHPDVGVAGLLKLANAIAVSTERAPEGADRLLSLVMDGLWRHEPPAR